MGGVVRDVWNVTQFADNAQSRSQTRDYPTAVTQAERDMGECGEENSDAWKLEVDRRNTAKNTACAEAFRNSCNRTILATARNAGIILDTAEIIRRRTLFEICANLKERGSKMLPEK